MLLPALIGVLLHLIAPAHASGQPQPQPEHPPSKTPVVDELREEADALRPLVQTGLAKAFLDAVTGLPEPSEQVVYRAKDGRTITPAEMAALPAEEQEAFTKRLLIPRFYYHTVYGTPLVYTRPLELLAERNPEAWAADTLAGKRVLDFGFGTIGHLRLLSLLGVEATGVDVEPLFKALYAGEKAPAPGMPTKGAVRILLGRWPASPDLAATVREHGPYDLFISKNTLKRGYIHPARPADPSRLVNLGVDDATFLKAVHDTLKPGGVFLIYNISPAQSLPSEAYIPHADGQCPFPRADLEKAGFEVVAYDEDDQGKIIDVWQALGMNQGKPREEMARELFAWWTMCRRK
jgi:SAM-dependent methyltransferase